MSLPILNSNYLLIIAGCQKYHLYSFRNNHYTYDGVPLKHNECYWELNNHEIMGVNPDFIDIYQRILCLYSNSLGNLDFVHHFPDDFLLMDFDKKEFI